MTYNAVKFLEGLFTRAGGSTTMALAEPTGQSTSLCPDVRQLPPPWREWFEERAAIKEYHGGMSRKQAEAQAFQETTELMRQERKNALGT